MQELTKNKGILEELKRQFLDLNSPSSFGAVHRFNSNANMNIPVEMGRRDAACAQLESIFFKTEFPNDCEERQLFYSRIIERMKMVEQRTELIVKASRSSSQVNDEGKALLLLSRLILKSFIILKELADSQVSDQEEFTSLKILYQTLPPESFAPLYSEFHHNEVELFQSIKEALKILQPLLVSLQNQRRQRFTASDSEHYDKAFSFYMKYYSNLENTY